MPIITYHSNNSGGSWWLTDDHWKALYARGWNVVWGGWYFCNTSFRSAPKNHVPCKDTCRGHQRFPSADSMTDNDRWLGGIAQEASKFFLHPIDGLKEFEIITGMDVMSEGCTCCGAPHIFKWEDADGHHYVSGEECATVLFPGKPTTLREALEHAENRR